jgi:hypothetical protein
MLCWKATPFRFWSLKSLLSSFTPRVMDYSTVYHDHDHEELLQKS